MWSALKGGGDDSLLGLYDDLKGNGCLTDNIDYCLN